MKSMKTAVFAAVTVATFGALGASAGETAWTGAANDGKWTTPGNWDDGLPQADGTASIARGDGSPFAVSLDDTAGQQMVSNLYVGGSAASLAVHGALKLDGGRMVLTNGAAMSVTENGSLWIDQLPLGTDANKQVVFNRIVGGSTLNLAGNFTITNASGWFDIGDDSYAVTSRLIQTGGTFFYRQNQGHKGIRLMKGGRIEVSGGEWDLMSNPSYGSPLDQRGGDIEFSGDAEVKGGGFFAFGSGHTIFRGSSIYWPMSWNPINVNIADVPALVEITENASIQRAKKENGTGFVDTAIRVGVTSGRKATLVLRSAANSNMGNSFQCGRASSSWGRLLVQSAFNEVGDYGIQLGACGDNPTATECPTGVVDVVGGVLSVGGSSSAWSKENISGIIVGSGIKRHDDHTTACYTGFFSLSGSGIVTNMAGFFAVGLGPAYGEYRQTGGHFAHTSSRAACVGQFGAEGHVDISGGEMSLNGPLYIGGAATNEIDRYKAKISNTPYCEHGGTGTFSVSNATVVLLKDTFIGMDGNGTLSVGPGAAVTGTSLYVTNGWETASSTLRFVLGAETAGKITLSGKLQVCSTGRVEVDTSACTAMTPFTVLEAAGIEGLTADDVQILGARSKSFKVSVSGTKITVGRSVGLAIFVR